jgi:ferredoxin
VKVVKVDLDLCQGHGKCYVAAPGFFEVGDDFGRAKFVGDPIDPSDAARIELAERAIRGCPESALSFMTDDEA